MFVYKVLTSSELVCASYDHIYVPIIMYCLRLFVVVLQEKSIYSQSFVLIASTVNELCVLN